MTAMPQSVPKNRTHRLSIAGALRAIHPRSNRAVNKYQSTKVTLLSTTQKTPVVRLGQDVPLVSGFRQSGTYDGRRAHSVAAQAGILAKMRQKGQTGAGQEG